MSTECDIFGNIFKTKFLWGWYCFVKGVWIPFWELKFAKTQTPQMECRPSIPTPLFMTCHGSFASFYLSFKSDIPSKSTLKWFQRAALFLVHIVDNGEAQRLWDVIYSTWSKDDRKQKGSLKISQIQRTIVIYSGTRRSSIFSMFSFCSIKPSNWCTVKVNVVYMLMYFGSCYLMVVFAKSNRELRSSRTIRKNHFKWDPLLAYWLCASPYICKKVCAALSSCIHDRDGHCSRRFRASF